MRSPRQTIADARADLRGHVDRLSAGLDTASVRIATALAVVGVIAVIALAVALACNARVVRDDEH